MLVQSCKFIFFMLQDLQDRYNFCLVVGFGEAQNVSHLEDPGTLLNTWFFCGNCCFHPHVSLHLQHWCTQWFILVIRKRNLGIPEKQPQQLVKLIHLPIVSINPRFYSIHWCTPPKTNGGIPKMMVWKKWLLFKDGHVWYLYYSTFLGCSWGISSDGKSHHRDTTESFAILRFRTFAVDVHQMLYRRISNSGKLFKGIQFFSLAWFSIQSSRIILLVSCLFLMSTAHSITNIKNCHMITLINSYYFHMLWVLVFVSLHELVYDNTWMWMSNSLPRTSMVCNLNMLHWKFWQKKKTASGLALQHGRSEMFIWRAFVIYGQSNFWRVGLPKKKHGVRSFRGNLSLAELNVYPHTPRSLT